MQVSQNGDLANWMIPKKLIKGMGGAMDLVNGVKKVIILMEHFDKNGNSKLLKNCTLPLTGQKVVKKVITNLGVFDVEDNKFKIIEIAPGVSKDFVKEKTKGTIF